MNAGPRSGAFPAVRLAEAARNEHERARAVDDALTSATEGLPSSRWGGPTPTDDGAARSALRAVGYGDDAAEVVESWHAVRGTLPDCAGGCGAKVPRPEAHGVAPHTPEAAQWSTCPACLGQSVRIAVYGTLRLGHGNWYRLLRGRAQHVATTRTAPGHAIGAGGIARLVRLTDAEARRRRCVGTVAVDVYRCRPSVLRDLDALEGHPRVWRREPILVEGGCGLLGPGQHLIEAYFWRNPDEVAVVEPSGDYEAGGGRGNCDRVSGEREALIAQTGGPETWAGTADCDQPRGRFLRSGTPTPDMDHTCCGNGCRYPGCEHARRPDADWAGTRRGGAS